MAVSHSSPTHRFEGKQRRRRRRRRRVSELTSHHLSLSLSGSLFKTNSCSSSSSFVLNCLFIFLLLLLFPCNLAPSDYFLLPNYSSHFLFYPPFFHFPSNFILLYVMPFFLLQQINFTKYFFIFLL